MASNPHTLALPAAATPNAPALSQPTTREVAISSGLHRGATFVVREGDLVVVGADVSCDICLSDPGIAPRHAALALHGSDISIRRLDGEISADGADVATSKRSPNDQSITLSLGASRVRLDVRAAAAGNARRAQRPAKVATPKQRALALACFVLFAIVATGLVARKLDASRPLTPPAPSVSEVRARITPEELLEQVRDVFRGQGYDAHVVHAGEGRVQIDNLDEAHERVRHAAEQARTDVPQLKELIFTSPDDAPPPEDPPRYGDDSGERIVTRIDGATAYLVAGAGTRYFTGSKLPSGHAIRRITARAVLLEREGQLEWFRF
jgi:Inner membrane component of T3SS, cytoplasmic domain